MTYILNRDFTVSAMGQKTGRMPESIHGCVVNGPDGTYGILLNPNSPRVRSGKTGIHEFCHIHFGHPDSDCELTEQEKEAQVREYERG